jgi:hypothetical protein
MFIVCDNRRKPLKLQNTSQKRGILCPVAAKRDGTWHGTDSRQRALVEQENKCCAGFTVPSR